MRLEFSTIEMMRMKIHLVRSPILYEETRLLALNRSTKKKWKWAIRRLHFQLVAVFEMAKEIETTDIAR